MSDVTVFPILASLMMPVEFVEVCERGEGKTEERRWEGGERRRGNVEKES